MARVTIHKQKSKSKVSSWEKEFVGEPIAELSDEHLPILGEVFRLFQYYRKSSATNAPQRNAALLAVGKCIEIWKKFGIPTKLDYNVTKNLLKLLALFRSVHYKNNEISKRRKEILWRRKLQCVFNVAAQDALKKCDGKNKQLLQKIEKETEELKRIEKSVNSKTTFDLGKILQEEHPSLKRKAEHAMDVEHAMKKCKVLFEKFGAHTGPENQLKGSSSFTDSNLMEEDIVPPNLPQAIVKEELNLDWDQNDNLLFSVEAISINKELFSGNLATLSFADNKTKLPHSVIKEELNLDWDESDNM